MPIDRRSILTIFASSRGPSRCTVPAALAAMALPRVARAQAGPPIDTAGGPVRGVSQSGVSRVPGACATSA